MLGAASINLKLLLRHSSARTAKIPLRSFNVVTEIRSGTGAYYKTANCQVSPAFVPEASRQIKIRFCVGCLN
jgi:hypothetical protein